MAFQFLCPQGHLLQGEEWQAGQQSICPICQSLFVIPSPGVGGEPVGRSIGHEVGIGPASRGMDYPPTWGGRPSPIQTDGPGGGALLSSGPLLDQPTFSPAGPSEHPVGGLGGTMSPSGGVGWPAPSQEAEPPDIFPTAPEAGPVPLQQPPVHVFCPSGHELETSREMLGQDALCPFCGVQFRLRWQDTREYRREKELEMERRLARQSKLWLQWAIAAAVVVIVALIIMIAIAASD